MVVEVEEEVVEEYEEEKIVGVVPGDILLTSHRWRNFWWLVCCESDVACVFPHNICVLHFAFRRFIRQRFLFSPLRLNARKQITMEDNDLAPSLLVNGSFYLVNLKIFTSLQIT